MLPSNLLIARRRRDKIRPVYASLNHENLGIAKLLIQTYKDFVGHRKGELNEAVDGLEGMGYDYRYVRGLSTILNRRCRLESNSAVDPVRARRTVFKLAHEREVPTAPEARQAVIRRAATEMGVTVDELEGSMYGDLEDELLLKDFEPIDPETLIMQYNLSLTQTLLFYSTELTFTATGNWQSIFRQINWLGLIYTVWRSDSGFQVKVDGPTSLFRLNRRYGTSLAKLLPTIVKSQGWRIQAKILRRRDDRRLLTLELDAKKHGEHIISPQPSKETYDSLVERDFANRFVALSTGWTLTREPEPIPVGRHVMIPDFWFRKGGLKVYMEVVGFWTPRYLEDKVKKLRQVGDIDMIVAADRALACKKLDRMREKLNIIYYKKRIPLRPILHHLKAKEKHLVNEQARLLRDKIFTFQQPVVETKTLAKKLGVLEEALRKALTKKEVPGYTYLGDLLIKEKTLKRIGEKLEKLLQESEPSLDEASKIIEDEGGKNPATIIDALGYRIEWRGIDPRSAKIRKKVKINLHVK